ncbi:MAG: hypothetical protein SPF22_07980 [Candidatus Onthovivens sp.]|nr:hypothetical protein [Candidatus Onthovivens sp.]
MKQIIKKKKITIQTQGSLRIKGGIRGPIEIPYMEDINVIGRMIMSGYKVTEILSTGEKVKLDIHNYNKENGKNDLYIGEEIVTSSNQLNTKPKQKTPVRSGGGVFNPIIDVYESK